MIIGPAPFAQHTQTLPAGTPWLHYDSSSVTIVDFKVVENNGKILLRWMTKNNQDVAMFEAERSTDSKPFAMTALVFGTDKPGNENYHFFEKKKQQAAYRIKVIHKNGVVNYSSVVTLHSGGQ